MGVLIFLAVTVIGGILFIINGISVLVGGCAAVTFDDSRRIGGRSFIIRATCLNEQQAAASDIPTWMGGWGLILLGILAITAFLWLTPILHFFARRQAEKEAKTIQALASAEQRRAEFTKSEDERLASARQAKAGAGIDLQEFLNATAEKCLRLRIICVMLSVGAGVAGFFAVISANDAPSMSLIGAAIAIPMAVASFAVLIWGEVTKRRYLGRAILLKLEPVWVGLAVSFFGFPGLVFALFALTLVTGT